MPDSLVTHNEFHSIVGELLTWGSPIFLMFLFRELIAEVASGLVWRFGSHLDEDEIIRYNGQYGRIARIGIFKTTIYLYTVDTENRIIGGDSLTLLNSELRKKEIAEPLKLVDEHAKLNPIVK